MLLKLIFFNESIGLHREKTRKLQLKYIASKVKKTIYSFLLIIFFYKAKPIYNMSFTNKICNKSNYEIDVWLKGILIVYGTFVMYVLRSVIYGICMISVYHILFISLNFINMSDSSLKKEKNLL